MNHEKKDISMFPEEQQVLMRQADILDIKIGKEFKEGFKVPEHEQKPFMDRITLLARERDALLTKIIELQRHYLGDDPKWSEVVGELTDAMEDWNKTYDKEYNEQHNA